MREIIDRGQSNSDRFFGGECVRIIIMSTNNLPTTRVLLTRIEIRLDYWKYSNFIILILYFSVKRRHPLLVYTPFRLMCSKECSDGDKGGVLILDLISFSTRECQCIKRKLFSRVNCL